MTVGRRSFLTSLTGFIACSPAIVRASSLMPVKQMVSGPLLLRAQMNNWDNMRALLMPGLMHLSETYQNIPAQWEGAFARLKAEFPAGMSPLHPTGAM